MRYPHLLQRLLIAESILGALVEEVARQMRVVLVAGSYLAASLDPACLSSCDLLVAVDGGAEAILAAGAVPGLLVGDMDSISSRTLVRVRELGAEIVELPTAKDETDTEAALRLVVERGAREVVVYGALGGPRLDHLLGNVLLLTAPWLDSVRVRLVEATTELYLAKGDATIEGAVGDTVSLVPLTAVVESVRTAGLLYPLRDEPLYQGSTRGISNVMTAPLAQVSHGLGVLLVVHELLGAREVSR
ncbi:MAG: thiamine diphosphokinase [Thermoleophilia bacterium]|nr:thiamine diphosphokinase [Thermoleophilia bacterium]